MPFDTQSPIMASEDSVFPDSLKIEHQTYIQSFYRRKGCTRSSSRLSHSHAATESDRMFFASAKLLQSSSPARRLHDEGEKKTTHPPFENLDARGMGCAHARRLRGRSPGKRVCAFRRGCTGLYVRDVGLFPNEVLN